MGNITSSIGDAENCVSQSFRCKWNSNSKRERMRLWLGNCSRLEEERRVWKERRISISSVWGQWEQDSGSTGKWGWPWILDDLGGWTLKERESYWRCLNMGGPIQHWALQFFCSWTKGKAQKREPGINIQPSRREAATTFQTLLRKGLGSKRSQERHAQKWKTPQRRKYGHSCQVDSPASLTQADFSRTQLRAQRPWRKTQFPTDASDAWVYW